MLTLGILLLVLGILLLVPTKRAVGSRRRHH